MDEKLKLYLGLLRALEELVIGLIVQCPRYHYAATPTSSTHGSPLVSGRSRHSAGPKIPKN